MKSGESQTEGESRKAYEEAKKQEQEKESIQVSEEYEQEIEDEETAEELEELAEVEAEEMNRGGGEISDEADRLLNEVDRLLRVEAERENIGTAESSISSLADEMRESIDPGEFEDGFEIITETTEVAAEEQGKDQKEFLQNIKETLEKPLKAVGSALEAGWTNTREATPDFKKKADHLISRAKSGFEKITGFLETSKEEDRDVIYSNADNMDVVSGETYVGEPPSEEKGPGELTDEEKRRAEKEEERLKRKEEEHKEETDKWLEDYTAPGELSEEEKERAEAERKRLEQKRKEAIEKTRGWLEEGEETMTEFNDLQKKLYNILENPQEYDISPKFEALQEEIEEVVDEWLEENNLSSEQEESLEEYLDYLDDKVEDLSGEERTREESVSKQEYHGEEAEKRIKDIFANNPEQADKIIEKVEEMEPEKSEATLEFIKKGQEIKEQWGELMELKQEIEDIDTDGFLSSVSKRLFGAEPPVPSIKFKGSSNEEFDPNNPDEGLPIINADKIKSKLKGQERWEEANLIDEYEEKLKNFDNSWGDFNSDTATPNIDEEIKEDIMNAIESTGKAKLLQS